MLTIQVWMFNFLDVLAWNYDLWLFNHLLIRLHRCCCWWVSDIYYGLRTCFQYLSSMPKSSEPWFLRNIFIIHNFIDPLKFIEDSHNWERSQNAIFKLVHRENWDCVINYEKICTSCQVYSFFYSWPRTEYVVPESNYLT